MKHNPPNAGEQRKLLHDAQRFALEYYRDEPLYKRASRIDLVLSLIVTLIVAMFIRMFIFEPVRVDGPSMQPTLYTNERMIVEKISYGFASPKRGEIIICRYPGYTESCVKRIIGLPGETIEVREGYIYINDVLLDESSYWQDIILGDMPKVEISDRCVFVIGDNRNMSHDSRDKRVGEIPYSRIIGRVRGVLWPPANMVIY